MSNSNNIKYKTSKKKEVFNRQDIPINLFNTLIIIDWDDTLYPTTWAIENSIDLTDPRSRTKYLTHFEYLDDQLSLSLNLMMTLGVVIIITNAMPEWIDLSVSVLPKTKICLKNIDIISARKRYQHKTKMVDWKKYTFQEELINRSNNNTFQNIMSLGDADFEYNALINLYKVNIIPNKYLKSIKFIKSNDFKIALEQITMIRENISNICKEPRHIDLTFDTS